MTDVLAWAAFVAGVTYGISRSIYGYPLRMSLWWFVYRQSIPALRALGTAATLLIYCGICTGFWVGVVTALLGWSPLYESHQAWFGRAALSGFGGSVVAGLFFGWSNQPGGEEILKAERGVWENTDDG